MKNTIYICGDSMCVTNNDKFHWVEQITKEFKSYKIKNLSYIGATNFSIAAQMEVAISDTQTAFVIATGADIFRINAVTRHYKRDAPENFNDNVKIFKPYDSVKNIWKNIYVESYNNPLVPAEKLYNLFCTDVHTRKNPSRSDPRKKITQIGIWMYDPENQTPEVKEEIPDEVFHAAEQYHRYLFNINERFHTDIMLFESKLYKMKYKEIPFLYNFGGITTIDNPHYDIFENVIKQVENNSDLEKNFCDINLSDIAALESRNGLFTSKPYHVSDIKNHNIIAKKYIEKIKECLQN